MQEANTQILQRDGRTALDSYMQAAEFQFKRKQAALQQAQQNADRVLKATDFNIAGIRDQDLDMLTKYGKENIYDFAYENPTALSPTMNDPESLQLANQFNQNFEKGRFLATKSKAIKAKYDEYRKTFIKDGDVDGLRQLDEWYKQTDLENFKEFNYQPLPDFNIYDHNKDILEGIVSENPDAMTSKNLAGGNVMYSIPKKEDKAKLEARVDTWLDGHKSGKEGYEYTFAHLKESNPDKYNEHLSASGGNFQAAARDWAKQAKIESLNIDLSPKNEFRNADSGGSGAGKKDEKPDGAQLIDAIYQFKTGAGGNEETRKVFDAATKKEGTAGTTSLFKDIGFTNKKGVSGNITKISRGGDGKMYVITENDIYANGRYNYKPENKIDNVWTQLVIPYYNQQYGANANEKLEELRQYAVDNNLASELGIPNIAKGQTKQEDPLGLFK